MSDYLEDDEQDELKGQLYSYLKDKAKRRKAVTSSDVYNGAAERFGEQEGLYDVGALAGAFSEAGSMMGTLGGKRAESNIVPEMNKALYNSTQGTTDNMRNLRSAEERDIGTDLNVGRFVNQIDQQADSRRRLDEQLQAKLEARNKRRLMPQIQGENGEPVLMDEYGEPETLPGYKYRDTSKPKSAPTTSYRSSNVLDDDGIPMNFEPKTGRYSKPDVPPGAKMKPGTAGKPAKVTDGQRSAAMFYQNAENALKVLEDMETKGYRPGKMKAVKDILVPDALGGYAYDDNEQRYMQAAEDWTAAKLRLESGASIPRDEVRSQSRIYMAQPGGSEDALKQRQASRRQAMSGLKIKAAGALSEGAATAPTGQVKVSNGKEELYIDESDLADAQADGFEVVE